MGNPDYLLVFFKPGENPEPVTHTAEEFPVDQWQEWASPVWMDIRQTNVLNKKGARTEADEKHICPLQLDFIDRCLVMWSNPGDIVFSPFTGIGSEGYQSIKRGRKFIGTELKRSYFDEATANLQLAESERGDFFR
jgi:DNA modification methylase